MLDVEQHLYVLSQAFSMAHRWFQQDSQTRTKKISYQMKHVACLLLFIFCHFKKGMIFKSESKKGLKSIFFYSPFVLRATIVKLIHLNNEYMKKECQHKNDIKYVPKYSLQKTIGCVCETIETLIEKSTSFSFVML